MIKLRNLKEAINRQTIERWKKDFQRFTKAIRNISNGEELFQFYQASKIWSHNFDIFVYNELLGQQLRRSSDDEYVHSRGDSVVAKEAWDLTLHISNMFIVDGIYHLEQQYPKLYTNYIPEAWNQIYTLWSKSKNKFYNKIGADGRKAFKAIENYFNRYDKEIPSLHVEDTFTKDGIEYKISYDETDPKWKETLQRAMYNINKGCIQIKKKGFGVVLKNLVIEIDETEGMSSKGAYSTRGAAATYNPTTDHLSIGSFGQYNTTTFIHELGHRYHFQIMNSKAALLWKQFYDKSMVPIPPDFFDVVFKAFYEVAKDKEKKTLSYEIYSKEHLIDIRNHIKDSLIRELYTAAFISERQMLFLQYTEDLKGVTDVATYTEVVKRLTMDEYKNKRSIQVDIVSDYGSTNDLEFFAETFMHYIMNYGDIPENTMYMFMLCTKRR